MNLADLQREAHAIAKEKGWWDEPRTFGDLIALVHSELSEALEAYRELGTTQTAYTVDAEGTRTTPQGVAYELADVVVRVADMAEHFTYCLEPDESIQDRNALDLALADLTSLGDWIARLHWIVA